MFLEKYEKNTVQLSTHVYLLICFSLIYVMGTLVIALNQKRAGSLYNLYKVCGTGAMRVPQMAGDPF